MADDNIKVGHYVIIQRQKYQRLYKFSHLNDVATLGKELIELKNINEQPYFTTFKMIPKTVGGKRLTTLEPVSDVCCLKEKVSVEITGSGTDNRNIVPSEASQQLKQDDIAKLREAGNSSSQIVGQIVEGSKTFTSKTEFSQHKYLKRKEKKYFEFLMIRRPSIRNLAEIMYRQEPEKILGLRIDSLSQMISYANVSSAGNFLLYESGTNGLIAAAIMNSIGANTTGKLVHIHQGNMPQKQAVLALNLEQEHLDRCISVNLYSVLRHYYQNKGGLKRKLDEITEAGDETQPPAKVAKSDDSNGHSEKTTETGIDSVDDASNGVAATEAKTDSVDDASNGAVTEATTDSVDDASNGTVTVPKKAVVPKWQLDNERGCEILRENMDALVIVAKEHPITIVNALLPFMKPSRPVVIFSLSREILMETFIDLKTSGNVTGLRLTSNWMRMYQVLPDRTHPDVNMSGNSGFLLSGFTIR